jgi:hypothetical protein
MLLLRKPILAASFATLVAAAAMAPQAHAGDPLLGAILGGGIGAAIGHNVNGHNGAAVGGVLGAVVGSSIAASNNYYGDPYYGPAPAPAYGYGPEYYGPAYPPAPAYYAPPPAYYAPSIVIGASYPVYRSHYYGHRHWDGHRYGH